MPTITPGASSTSGYIVAQSSTYATAAAGTAGTPDNSGAGHVGQYGPSAAPFTCYEAFLAFDTSAIPVGATITSAILSFTPSQVNVGGSTFTIEARTKNAGALFLPALDAGDWMTPAAIGSGTTLRATRASAGITTGASNNFTDVAMAAGIVKGGTTEILLVSDRFRAGTSPTGNEYCNFQANPIGGVAPVLTIVYTVPPAALAGAIAGAASITGALTIRAGLAGPIVAHATVAGALTKPPAALGGAIAGAASIAGDLTPAPPGAVLAGSSSGAATVTATVTPAPPGAVLAGSSSGAATVTASLTALIGGSLGATVNGRATVSASLSTVAGLAGVVTGSAGVSGALAAAAGLAGVVAGSSSSSGALRLAAGFAGTVTGTSSATGALRVRAGLAGAIAGHAALVGDLTIDAGGPLPVLVEFRGLISYSDGSSAVGLWQEITCDVFGLGWKRGSHEYRGVFGIPDAAGADLYLYDPALNLDPANAAGSWYGQIDVGAEIRISMGLVDFYGLITDISHDLEPPAFPGGAPMPVAHIAALDPQGRMSTVDLPQNGATYELEETTGARIARLVALAEVPGTHAIATGGRILAGGAYWPATDSWSMIVDVMQNELGSLEWLPEPTYSSLRTHTRETTWPDTPPATVLDLGCHGGAIPIYSAKPSTPINTVRNQVIAARGNGLDSTPTEWDGSSQADYGLRPMTKSDLQFRDAADRDAWANFVLAHNGYPLQTWTLETRPDRAAQVFAIESTPLYVSWARVTVEGYGPVIDRSMRVLGVSWSIDSSAAAVCEITVGWDIPRPPLVPPG